MLQEETMIWYINIGWMIFSIGVFFIGIHIGKKIVLKEMAIYQAKMNMQRAYQQSLQMWSERIGNE